MGFDFKVEIFNSVFSSIDGLCFRSFKSLISAFPIEYDILPKYEFTNLLILRLVYNFESSSSLLVLYFLQHAAYLANTNHGL